MELLRKLMSTIREKVPKKPKWITEVVWAELIAQCEDEDYMSLRCGKHKSSFRYWRFIAHPRI